MYQRTYEEIRRMVRTALLSTPVARAIARKGVKLVSGASSPFLPRMWGQFSLLDDPSGDPDGFSFDYVASTEFGFPHNSDPYRVRRYGDSRGASEGRIVANVLGVGPAASALSVRVEDGSFVGTAPSCPLDALGLHESAWTEITLPTTPTPEDAALISWVVENPTSATGSARVGTCQFQVR